MTDNDMLTKFVSAEVNSWLKNRGKHGRNYPHSTNSNHNQAVMLTVETAKQLIHNGYFYIDIIEEQIRHGYNVKANQERVAQYKREITMLENWINANLQIDDASIL